MKQSIPFFFKRCLQTTFGEVKVMTIVHELVCFKVDFHLTSSCHQECFLLLWNNKECFSCDPLARLQGKIGYISMKVSAPKM